MQTLLQDLRYTLRGMRRAPGFTLIAVFTLALGIGSATAVFSVIDAVLLRPLPFAHQDRLVFPDTHARSGYTQPWSYLSYVDARRDLRTFEGLAGYSDFLHINLESPSGPVSVQAVKGTDNFFSVLGVKPILGRTYLPGEDQPGRDDIAVLSYETWQANFGGQPGVVGTVVRLDGVPYTVIGVMPAGFRFPLSARNAIYTPLHVDPRWKANRGSHWMRTVGLVKEGVSLPLAQADFRRVLADLARAYPDMDGGRSVSLMPLREQIVGRAAQPLQTLIFAVLALLAIACVNVAGLLLARGVKREREVALRAAVGAGRFRLVRQMLTESLVLSFAGLAGGVLLSVALLAGMRTFLVDAMARGAEVHLNVEVLLVALALSVLSSVTASLAPALRLSGTAPNRALRSGGATGTGRGQHRLRSAFVITQVAFSLVLLVLSGLLLRNLHGLLNTNLGFDPQHILAEHVSLSPGRYDGRDPLVSFYQPLLERVSHLPGVRSAGLIDTLPIQSWGVNADVHIAGQPPYPPQAEMLAETRFVSSGYFDAMGIRLKSGRLLSEAQDTPDHPAGSVVVNEAFRRKFFSGGGGDPVGAHIDDADKAEMKTGIVGVVSDVRQNLPDPSMGEMDWLVDEISPKERLDNFANMTLVVRADGDPRLLIPALRHIMHQIDPTVPFSAPETMTEVVRESLVFQRLENWLFGIFAAFALLLAVVGLHGLITHEVELRTRDIGVRMALGSTRARVGALILKRVGLLLCGGLAAGWVLTLAMRQLLAAVIELHPGRDAVFLLAITALLAVCGLAASLWPARRAASIQPTQALRAE